MIADSVNLFYCLYQQTCGHFGRTLPISDITQFRRWYKARWEQNYLDMGFAEHELDTVLGYARDHVDYADVRLFPEVVATIRTLAPRYRLGIASTTDAALIRGKLAEQGLLDLFPVVVGGEEGGSDKVARYGDALSLLGVDPKRSVGVGDTPLDVHCARHWGMRTVGVTYGWNDHDLVAAAAPDRLVHHPAEVEGAVLSLMT